MGHFAPSSDRLVAHHQFDTVPTADPVCHVIFVEMPQVSG